MTVQNIYDLLDAVAPFETQEDFDNSGLLVGSPGQPVSRVLFALDVTEAVLEEAVSLGVQLIVTHHPLMFSPIQRLTDETYEGRLIRRMIRENISLIACHTCLDKAPGGINDALAECCALLDVTGEGFLRVGALPVPMKAAELREYLCAALGSNVVLMGDGERTVSRLGLCSGAGSGEWEEAARLGAEGFLTGEVKHHHALAMADAGVVCFEGGHFATERPGIFALADALQSAAIGLQYKLEIFKSAVEAYASLPAMRQAD